jgi:hypothetical protein
MSWSRRSAAHLLKRDEARTIATNIAKPPGLLENVVGGITGRAGAGATPIMRIEHTRRVLGD